MYIWAISLLLGYAWLAIFWELPLRALFWDQQLMEGLVRGLFGWPWEEYATNLDISQNIDRLQQSIGYVWLISGLFLLLGRRYNKLLKPLLILSSLLLLCIMILKWKNAFWRLGNLMEHSIQWTLPLLCIGIWNREQSSQTRLDEKQWTFLLKIVIGLTFAGHGFYALGIHPVPGHFIEMVIGFFGCSEHSAQIFLAVMGGLDLLCVIALFIPRLDGFALIYAIIWGFVTALARLVCHVESPFILEGLIQWTPQTLIRLGHGGLPLYLYMCLRKK